jgi:hypothetical protein
MVQIDSHDACAERAVEGNLLFDMLSLPARQAIFRSMSLHMVSAGTKIISQGDTDATKFYVLEKGTCDVFVTNEATGNVPKKVHTYPSGRYDLSGAAALHKTPHPTLA